MANILGSLLIELTANTAQFLGAMDKASFAAKKTGQEIQGAFSRVGGLASQALAPFGAVGAQVGMALQTMGAGAGKAFSSFTQFGVAGRIAASSAVALGAGAALAEAGLIGLTIHTAEHIAKMGELSQATGVNIESLSALSFVAKSVGIDTDTMAKGLEKMSKSAFAAATASGNTISAYSRLGIAVKDSGGQMRSVDAVFADVADKFSKMPDGIAKTALAMQLFGRGGAALIPVLNRGKAAMEEQIATARALGIVLTEEDAAKAEQFKSSLVTLGAAFGGIAIQIEREMLPALQSFVNFIVNDMKGSSSTLKTLIDGFGWLTKAIVTMVEFGTALLGGFGDVIRTLAANAILSFEGMGSVMADVLTGNFSRAVVDAKAANAAINEGFTTLGHDLMAKAATFSAAYDEIWNPKAPKVVPAPKSGAGAGVNTADPAMAAIKERLAALRLEIEQWQKLASSGSAAEALIAQAIKAGTVEFARMQAMAAKNPAVAAVVAQNEGLIKAAAAAGVFGKVIKEDIDSLDKQKQKLLEQADAAKEMSAAFEQGGPAIAQAALNAQFADQRALVKVLTDAHATLLRLWGAENPVVVELANGLKSLNGILAGAETAAQAVGIRKFNEELDDQRQQFNALKPFVDALNASFMQSEAAVRAANIELQLQIIIQEAYRKGIILTNAEIAKQRKLLSDAAVQSDEEARSQEAGQFTIAALYDRQIAKLERVREVMKGTKQDTLLIDAAIYDANQQFIQQWDTAAMKVGTFGQGFKAMLNEIMLAGENFQEKFFGAMLKAVDDLSSKLAQFVVTGKADFKSLFQSLEQDIMKASFQKLIGSIASKIPGLGALGLGGKPDGSSKERALWTRNADALGGLAKGIPGASGTGDQGDSGNGTGGIFQKMQDSMAKVMKTIMKVMTDIISEITKVISQIMKAIVSVIGSVLKAIGGLFGGGRAGGGDVVPGKAYMVGEKHPEWFLPDVAGQIVPTLQSGNSKSAVIYAPVYNINTPDADSFRRSQSQILQSGFSAMALAHARNG